MKSQTSVMTAFKSLQATARAVEKGRFEAIKQRDELRRVLGENRRLHALNRSKNESLNNESIHIIRTNADAVKASQHDAHDRLSALEAVMRVMQEEIEEKTRRLCESEQAYSDQHTEQARLQRRSSQLQAELEHQQKRLEVAGQRHQAAAIAAAEDRTRAGDEINTIKIEHNQIRDAIARSQLRTAAASSYISMVLGVNADLVQGLEQQSKAKQELNKFVIVPRYRWPKGQIRGALSLIASAATDSLYSAREARQGRRGRRRGSHRLLKRPDFDLSLNQDCAMPLGNGRTVRTVAERRGKRSSRKIMYEEVLHPDSDVGAVDFLNALVHKSNSASRKMKADWRPSSASNRLPSYMRPKTY